jgi:hypothetical protein
MKEMVVVVVVVVVGRPVAHTLNRTWLPLMYGACNP